MLSLSNLLCDHRTGNEPLRYGHRAAASEGPPRPVVVWAVTKACNLRCVHCYASAEPNAAPGELTTEEGRVLLEDLAKFKVPAVLFSGGEPLHRPDTPQLIGYAQSLGLNCTLSTNGLLIDDLMADRLAAMELKYVGVSIDGRRERHDKLRGQPGAFDGSITAIRHCRERGIKVGLRFTIHGLNFDDLDHVIDLALEHGVQRLCIYRLAYAGRGSRMHTVDLTPQQTRQIVDRLIRRTRWCHEAGFPLDVLTVANHADAAYLLLHLERTDAARAAWATKLLEASGGNRSGCHVASIDPLGHVHYDQFSWHHRCGNVRQEKFSRLWAEARDPRLAILRDRRTHLPARCRSCRFLNVCNGNLRTRAECATGDWLALDPACYLTDAEIIYPESRPAGHESVL